jgi:putative ABC transport system substrate-binding protein
MSSNRRVGVVRVLVIAAVVAAVGYLLYKRQGPTQTRVCICQIASHPSLDAVRDGAIAALGQAGFTEASGTLVESQNAEGDMGTAKTIVDTFVQSEASVIIPITTPMAQAAAKATETIPIVFGAVTDPVGAGVVKSIEAPGANVTGVSDIWPIMEDLELLKRVCPKAKSVGTVYNPGEANSVFTVKLIRDACKQLGLELHEASVAKGTEVLGATQSLVGKVDTLFTAADSTVGAAFESVIKVAQENRLPLFVGDGDSVKRGAIACHGVDYADVGRLTGELAARVLRGEDPAKLPVVVVTKTRVIVNPSAAEKMGVTLSQDLIAEADEVVR